MAGTKTHRVVAHHAARPQQDHRHHLEGKGVISFVQWVGEARLAIPAEVQSAVLHDERTARQPDEAVAVLVWNACGCEAKASLEHGSAPLWARRRRAQEQHAVAIGLVPANAIDKERGE